MTAALSRRSGPAASGSLQRRTRTRYTSTPRAAPVRHPLAEHPRVAQHVAAEGRRGRRLPVQHKLTYLEQWIAERWERPQPNPLSTEHRPGAAALIEWRRRRQPSIADRLLRIAVDELQDERQRFVRDARGGVQLHDLGRPEHRDSVSRCSPLTSKVEPRVGSGGGVQVRSSCGLLHARGAAAKSTSASQISLGKEMPSNHNTMPSIRTAGCRDRRSGARRARAAARSRARRSTREPPLFEIVHPTCGAGSGSTTSR